MNHGLNECIKLWEFPDTLLNRSRSESTPGMTSGVSTGDVKVFGKRRCRSQSVTAVSALSPS